MWFSYRASGRHALWINFVMQDRWSMCSVAGSFRRDEDVALEFSVKFGREDVVLAVIVGDLVVSCVDFKIFVQC